MLGAARAEMALVETGALKSLSGAAKPGFVLESLDRVRTSLSEQSGRAVLVHFFATWCEPCRDELPALDRLAKRAAGDGLRLVVVSVAEPPGRVRRFAAELGLAFPILLD